MKKMLILVLACASVQLMAMDRDAKIRENSSEISAAIKDYYFAARQGWQGGRIAAGQRLISRLQEALDLQYTPSAKLFWIPTAAGTKSINEFASKNGDTILLQWFSRPPFNSPLDPAAKAELDRISESIKSSAQPSYYHECRPSERESGLCSFGESGLDIGRR